MVLSSETPTQTRSKASLHPFRYHCYFAEVGNFGEVLAQMDDIERELKGTALTNLRVFNRTYRIITQNVAAKIGQGYFGDDVAMEHFDCVFARYYFASLKRYTDEESVPSAWQILFNSCREDRLYQFQYLALGVNAHVNHDLAFALLDTRESQNYVDFAHIDAVIEVSLPEVLADFEERSVLLDALKRSAFILYAPWLSRLIRRWRATAWRRMMELSAENITATEIDRFSEERARLLTSKYAWWLQFPLLFL